MCGIVDSVRNGADDMNQMEFFASLPDCKLSDAIEFQYIQVADLYEFSRINSREFMDVMIE